MRESRSLSLSSPQTMTTAPTQPTLPERKRSDEDEAPSKRTKTFNHEDPTVNDSPSNRRTLTFRFLWSSPLNLIDHRWPLTSAMIKTRTAAAMSGSLGIDQSPILDCARHWGKACAEECKSQFWMLEGATEAELNLIESSIANPQREVIFLGDDEEEKGANLAEQQVNGVDKDITDSSIANEIHAESIRELEQVLATEAQLIEENAGIEGRLREAIADGKKRVAKLRLVAEKASSLLKQVNR